MCANLNYIWCLQKHKLIEKNSVNWIGFCMFVEKYFLILHISSSKKSCESKIFMAFVKNICCFCILNNNRTMTCQPRDTVILFIKTTWYLCMRLKNIFLLPWQWYTWRGRHGEQSFVKNKAWKVNETAIDGEVVKFCKIQNRALLVLLVISNILKYSGRHM